MYFLKGPGLLLNQALIQYGISFLRNKQYDMLSTPLFMKKDIMAKTAQLSDFDDQLYKYLPFFFFFFDFLMIFFFFKKKGFLVVMKVIST